MEILKMIFYFTQEQHSYIPTSYEVFFTIHTVVLQKK